MKEGNEIAGREASSCQLSDTTRKDVSSPVVQGDRRGMENSPYLPERCHSVRYSLVGKICSGLEWGIPDQRIRR